MSIESAPAKLMTAEEFCDWVHRPENDNRWFELVRGEVIELPPPLKPHGSICFNICRIVGNYIFERGIGYATSNDSGVILERDPDTVRGPDIAYYTDAETFEELHPKYGEVPPLLVIEVLSPDDRADRITRKVLDYLQNGVLLVWLVDFEARTVTVYKPSDGPRLLGEKDELTGNSVLPGFRCRVEEFFRLPSVQKPTKGKSKKRRGK